MCFLGKGRVGCNSWPNSQIPVWINFNCISCWDIMVLLAENYNIILARIGMDRLG